MSRSSIIGSILGTAVGDSIGLPYEGLSKQRAARLLGPPVRHRFFLGRGMVSDDTEHVCMVAQSLIAAGGDVDVFEKSLAWRLQFWLLGLPAGVGFATLRSILRLWMGFSPKRSGVFSAGNGPAMRATIIGAAIEDPVALREFVRSSTRITHTDPKAEYGALAVALAARMAVDGGSASGDEFVDELRQRLDGEGEELVSLLSDAVGSVKKRQSTEIFAESLGFTKGVSGYIYHTVPVAVHAWLSHQREITEAVRAVIRCGGDTDTVGAVVGGIVGASVGREGILAAWLEGLVERPRTVEWMERLGVQLDEAVRSGVPARPPRLPVITTLLRNLVFLKIVLFHGFRRLFPPY